MDKSVEQVNIKQEPVAESQGLVNDNKSGLAQENVGADQNSSLMLMILEQLGNFSYTKRIPFSIEVFVDLFQMLFSKRRMT